MTPIKGYRTEWTSMGGNNKSSIGMNCHRYDFWYEDEDGNEKVDRIMVDLGAGSGDDGAWGYHRLLPDIVEDLKQTKALIIPHAHFDHLGGIWFYIMSPFLTTRSGIETGFELPPIYGTPYTMAKLEQYLIMNMENVVASDKFSDEQKQDLSVRVNKVISNLKYMVPGNGYRFGHIEVFPHPSSHSTLHCVALEIKTPTTRIVHTSDITDDDSYLQPYTTDLNRFKALGDKGVDYVTIDSTRADKERQSPRESDVIKSLTKIIKENNDKRAVIPVMGGHDQRLVSLIKVAQDTDRDLYVVGPKMRLTFDLFKQVGGIIPHNLNVHYISKPGHENKTPRNKAIVLTTGSQGERNTPIRRALLDRSYKKLTLDPVDDMVIFSSTMLRFNEARYRPMLNELQNKGFTHFTNFNTKRVLNASGHADAPGLRKILRALKPTYGIPAHGMLDGRGESRPKGLLYYCADIMQGLGIAPLVVGNGQIMRLDHPDGPKPVTRDYARPHTWLAIQRALYDINDKTNHYQVMRIDPNAEKDQLRRKNEFNKGVSFDNTI